MLKNFDYKIISVMCMLMLSITSCVTGNDVDSAKPATIRLSLGTSLTTKAVKTTNTRTSTGFPTDNGGTVGVGEGTINTVCVGLFDKDGNTITIHEYTYTNGQSEDILTTTQVTKMVVVANAKSGAFAGVATEHDFLLKELQLSYTTSSDGQSNTNATTAGSQTTTALPMTSGEVSPLSLSGDATTDKTVELTRTVARVSVSSISTSFDSSSPYAGATFTPTEIFMYNVNDGYTCGGTASASATTVSGESTVSASYAYLGTGTITNYDAPTPTTPQFFYVFPHNSTNPTKLVIKGTFTPSGGSAQIVYYPVVISHAQDGTTFTDDKNNTSTTTTNDGEIEANKTYDIKVTIKGIGVDVPSKNIDPSSVTINSQVHDWTQALDTININDVPGIGEYYFSDGSWGTLTDRATQTVYPIGVVFSNTTSANDKAHGWTHGYAMALTNATTNTTTKTCMWGPNATENGETFTDAYGTYKYNWCSDEVYSSFITDKDGYCETQAIKNNHTLSSSSYPAFYYALNYNTYVATSGSSGWFLPSIGQWCDICANLGGITSAPVDPSDKCYCSWSNCSSKVASSINSYLSAIITYSQDHNFNYSSPDLFSNIAMSFIDANSNSKNYSGEAYWTSSEIWSDGVLFTDFCDNENFCFSNYYKDTGYFRVRACIAF